MKVQVKQYHIDSGNRCSATNCPIALAIGEKLGHNVSIGMDSGHVWFPNVTKKIYFPKVVSDWILAYDCRQQVSPVEIEISF